MFETLLASTGIGSSRIDLILDKEYVKIGKEVTGKIVITGGNSKQQIEGLVVNFNMESVHAFNPEQIQETIATVKLIQNEFTILAKEEKILPFSFTCPNSLPVSTPTTKYYFDTDLEIKWGLDSHDRDYIDVWSQEPLNHLLESFTLLDFKKIWEGLYEDENKWIQLCNFQPTAHFSGQVSRMMISISKHSEQELHGYYQVYQDETKLMNEMIDFGNNNATPFHFTNQELATCDLAVTQIKKLIRRKIG